MTWTYSGDPASSDTDKYRFLISDTDELDPVLQDEEIGFILGQYSDHDTRLYYLYDRATDLFARKIKRSLGPQYEDPTTRQQYFKEKADYYKRKVFSSAGLSLPKSCDTIFTKGMHDNVY